MTDSRIKFTRPFERLAAGEPPVRPLYPTPPSEVAWFRNPRYIVLRGAPELDYKHDGLWLEVAEIPSFAPPRVGATEVTLRPAGRYETRDDGAWAEVYEVTW